MAKCILCDKDAKRKGYCDNHYMQQLRKKKKEAGLCAVCKLPAVRAGYCEKHWLDRKKRFDKFFSVDDNRQRVNKSHSDAHRRIKREVIDKLGGKCACCGETNIGFLSIDHIDGNGREHRKSVKMPSNSIYYWLKKNNYPQGFQVLCMNCNWGRSHNGGVCPHKEVRV